MIVVIDYGVGNVGSIANMLRKIGAPARIGRAADDLREASKLILPGVGAFDNGMNCLRARGLVPVLEEVVGAGKPILGICLGMHLFTRGSQEGQATGLGWIDADVVRFRFGPEHKRIKIPHMGWNRVETTDPEGIVPPASRFYFVHGYHVRCNVRADVLGTTTYGYPFHSAFRHGNIHGVQFHPEKSHRFGMALLERFWKQPA